MSIPRAFDCLRRLVPVAMFLFGMYLLCIEFETVQNHLGASDGHNMKRSNAVFDWIDTDGVTLSHIQGDPTTCKDVIYTGHTLDPFPAAGEDKGSSEMVTRTWESMAYIIRTSPALKGNSCYAFFGVSSPWIDRSGREFHPVWGRLPATALVMAAFPQADVFLYMDSDALLSFPDKSPTTMYNELAFDGYGEDATFQQLKPGLIVNKPFTGWACEQCQNIRLGHGCLNSGALLWNRAKAEPILQAWWASRNMDESKNFFDPETGEAFHGWTGDDAKRVGDKMGEQNRLMYLYGTDPRVREAIWSVPRQKSSTNSTSCPSAVEGHIPCLQNDFSRGIKWNPSKPSCFISHYADDKEQAIKHSEVMLMHWNRLRR